MMTHEPIDYTGPDLDADTTPTQVQHPWRATARTILAVVVAAGIVLPVAWGVIQEEIGAYLGEQVLGVVGWIVGLLVAVSTAVTRIIAIPQVNAWLSRIGLGATPAE